MARTLIKPVVKNTIKNEALNKTSPVSDYVFAVLQTLSTHHINLYNEIKEKTIDDGFLCISKRLGINDYPVGDALAIEILKKLDLIIKF